MIDLSEKVITVSDAAKRIPRRRAGRRCHVATAYRWTVAGCRGVVLESLQVGATRCTSVQALQRFFDALTRQTADEQTKPGPYPRARAADIKKAENVLAAAGI